VGGYIGECRPERESVLALSAAAGTSLTLAMSVHRPKFDARFGVAWANRTPLFGELPAPSSRSETSRAVVAPDDGQVLARCCVPPWWVVVHAAFAHVHASDEGKVKRTAALDHTSAHGADLSMLSGMSWVVPGPSISRHHRPAVSS
jgi:hypothetical protein